MASEALLRIKLLAKNLTGPAFTKVRRSLLAVQRLGQRAFRTMGRAAKSAQIQILGIVAAFGGFRALVSGPAEFNRELARTATLGEEARGRIEEFGTAVRDLSVASGVAPDQLADGLFNVISAGTQASDAMGVLEEATRLAVAGQSDLTAAVKGLATVANSFSLTGQEGFREIAENLFAAQVIGKTTIEELSNNIGKLGAIAANSAIPMDQLFTALSEVTQVANNTEEASTGLRAAIIAIKKPTTEMKEILIDLGIPLGDAAFKGRNLGEMFAGIRKRAKELDYPMEVVVGKVRAVTAALILGEEGGDRYNRALSKQRRLMDELGISYEVMQKQLATTIDRTKNLFTVLAQDFSAGALIGVNETLKASIENLQIMRVEAQIFGLEFRKSIETQVLPGVSKITNSFKFMFHSTMLIIHSIQGRFEWVISTIREGIRETVGLMQTLGIVDSPISKFNDDLEEFNARSSETVKAWQKVRAQLEAIDRFDQETSAGKNLQQATRLGNPDEVRKWMDRLSTINRLRGEESRLAKQLTEHERDTWGFLVRRREGLIDLGARFRSDTLVLSGNLDLAERLKDLQHDVAMENRALLGAELLVKDIEGITAALNAIGDSPVNTELVANLNVQLREARTELERIKNAEAFKNLADLTGITTVLGWIDEFQGRVQKAQIETIKLEEAASGLSLTLADIHNSEIVLTLADIHRIAVEGTTGFERLGLSIRAFRSDFVEGMNSALESADSLQTQIQQLGASMISTAENAVARFFDGIASGSLTAKEAFANFLRAIASEINRFLAKQAVAKFVEFFLSMGMSGGGGGGPTIDLGDGRGSQPFPVAANALGGIVTRPEVSLIGEAGPEAIVPLPNGRSIPVDFRGSARGGGDTFNINISAVDGASVQRLLSSDNGRRAIQNAMRDARSTRRDLR